MAQAFLKDPEALLDYTIDWSSWLGSDTISTSAWTVPAGLTQVRSTNTTTTAAIWVSGGTIGASYTLVNHIVTAGGRTDERSIVLALANK